MPHLETLLAQAGNEPDAATGALIPPLHLSTTYERDADGSYPRGFSYSRSDNPTRRRFEEFMAQLEGGAGCAAFSSGMAAAGAVLQSLRPGDHLVLADDAYYGVRRLISETFQPWGLRFTIADFTDIDAVTAAATEQTRLIWAETPSNPLVKITDLTAIIEVGRRTGAATILDGTWTTPLLQRPLEHGADLVLHSTTKYLGGHSDVLGGVVVAREDGEFFQRIRRLQTFGGPVMDPFSAWLTLRGMRTLAPRLRLQSATAGMLAQFLAAHRRVEATFYPGLPHHPGHDIASRQMSDFGGMLSFQIDGDEKDALAVAARTRVFKRATSLGGTESLIEHRASIEEKPSATPANLLRISVGLEHPDDLMSDIEHALNA